jgi:hypothetical protein
MIAMRLSMILVGLSLLVPTVGLAQTDSDWSKPQLVFESAGYTAFPLIAADPAGDVHVVFMRWNQAGRQVTSTTQGALLYARLHDGEWSKPVEIATPPGGGALNLPAMTLDAQDYLHVVFQGGKDNQIYYSRAHVSDAGSVRGWSKPQTLSNTSGNASDISASGDGVVRFVYAAQDGSVHYRSSADNGQSWSGDLTVVGPKDAAGAQTQADYPRVLSDAPGHVNITWNEYRLPDGWPSVGAFYAQSLDAGATWSAPRRIAPQDHGFVTMSASQPGVIARAWSSTADIGERRFQQSTDGGQTWTPSVVINDPSQLYGGFSGFVGMTTDSAGILHLVTSLGSHALTDTGIYELTWSGHTWTEPQQVSIGVGAGTNALNPERSIEQAQVAISRGNRLHVVYEENFNRVWYGTRLLDTPELPLSAPAKPLASGRTVAPAPTATPVVEPTALPVPTLARPAAAAPANTADQRPPDAFQVLLLTFVPSLLLVLGVVAWRLRR